MMKNKVKELRARFGYSQETLGKEAGATRQTIAAIEKGDYVPSLLLALNICRAFSLPMEEVFWLEEEKNEFEKKSVFSPCTLRIGLLDAYFLYGSGTADRSVFPNGGSSSFELNITPFLLFIICAALYIYAEKKNETAKSTGLCPMNLRNRMKENK